MTPGHKQWLKRGLLLGLALLALIPLADFGYARVVAFRQARWEQSIPRGPDGVRAGCADYTVGQGPVALLLIHGFADSPAVFRQMAEYWAARGFTCRAMRLPGAALPAAQAAQVSREQWLAAIAAEVDALRTNHAAVWLVGHSLGGALALNYALEPRSPPVDGLVLLAPLVEVSRRRSPVLGPETWFSIGQRFRLFSKLAENVFPLDVHDPAAQARDLRMRFVPFTHYEALFATVAGLPGQASNLKLPTLVFLTADDLVVDSAAAAGFFAQAPATRIQWVPDAGHVIPLDNGWELVAADTTTFIMAATAAVRGKEKTP